MNSIFSSSQAWAKENAYSFWQKSETESTNDQAKEEAFTVSEFKLYLTDKQLTGRGRGTNSWGNAKSGSQLLSTWTFLKDHPPQHILPPLVGLALYNTVKKNWPQLEWSLKAPNDLFLKDKKVAGLLIENIQQGERHFVGIGLGFNVSGSPSDIETATHLTSENGTGSLIAEDKWFSFLTDLKYLLEQAVTDSTTSHLQIEQREELLRALNANPFKKEIYVEVSDQGDLITESGTLSWQEI